MTELMKRFQEETGIDIFGGWTYEIVNGLMTPPFNESPWMKFNEWLAEQLTWRPVSEKPEKKQEVLISYVDCYGHRINVLGSYVRRLDEEAGVTDDEDIMEYSEEKDEYYLAEGWYEHTTHSEYDCWLLHEKVDMWLPIPPAPEGE